MLRSCCQLGNLVELLGQLGIFVVSVPFGEVVDEIVLRFLCAVRLFSDVFGLLSNTFEHSFVRLLLWSNLIRYLLEVLQLTDKSIEAAANFLVSAMFQLTNFGLLERSNFTALSYHRCQCHLKRIEQQ